MSAAPAVAGRRRRDGAASDLRAAGAASLAVLAVVALAAAVTAIAFTGPARDALGFGFGGVPRTFGEAVSIFAHNARLMGAVAAAVIVVQSLRLERADGSLGRGGELARSGVDVVLGVAVAVNAAVVGVAFGAYGDRMVKATLPHAPVELAAFGLALALYLRARRERLRPRPALLLAAAALALLAFAALIEVFAQL